MELAQKIKAAATQLFVASGIKAVSMDDVSKSVGISKRTLYETFASKDALLMACVDDLMRMRIEKLESQLVLATSFVDLMLRSMYEAMSMLQSVSVVFFEDIERLNYVHVNEAVTSKLDGMKARITALIEEGKRKGILREDVDSTLISVLLFHEHSKGMMRKIAEARGCEVSYVIKHFSLIFLRGMATDKGVRLIDEQVDSINKTTQNAKIDS